MENGCVHYIVSLGSVLSDGAVPSCQEWWGVEDYVDLASSHLHHHEYSDEAFLRLC